MKVRDTAIGTDLGNRPVAIVAARAAAMAALLSALGCGQLLGPKATLGPGSIVRGRGLYNEVITATDNEQTLQLIVRARYGEPLGLLSVASVTANLRATAKAEAQFGIGSTENFKGNLVPLAAGLAYEENPTISYSPVQGERYAKNILSPLGLDVLVLLLGTESAPPQLLSLLVKQLNGLRNPMHGPAAARAAFQDSIRTLARLEDAGQATWTSSSTKPGSFALVIHGYAPENRDVVRDLLRAWGLPESLARQGRDIVLPAKLAVGSGPEPALNVQTRSVYELIEIAAAGVEVPREDAARELAGPGLDALAPSERLLEIRSSRWRPSSEVLAAVWHRGWWYYIAANDSRSKLAFRLLQTLINLVLVEAAPQAMPTLTLPVGK